MAVRFIRFQNNRLSSMAFGWSNRPENPLFLSYRMMYQEIFNPNCIPHEMSLRAR